MVAGSERPAEAKQRSLAKIRISRSGEGQMTDQPTESRFVLRKGAAEDKWIWDRNIRGPARLERGFATELSEEEARQILKKLRQAHGEQ